MLTLFYDDMRVSLSMCLPPDQKLKRSTLHILYWVPTYSNSYLSSETMNAGSRSGGYVFMYSSLQCSCSFSSFLFLSVSLSTGCRCHHHHHHHHLPPPPPPPPPLLYMCRSFILLWIVLIYLNNTFYLTRSISTANWLVSVSQWLKNTNRYGKRVIGLQLRFYFV